MKKIMFIFGTRPEFIKVLPVIKEFKSHPEKYDVIVLSTGQHKEMLSNLMSSFEVDADFDLEIMDKCNGLVDILTKSLEGIDKIIKQTTPDFIFVHGDTAATLAGSLGGFYNNTKIGHIEAGLRTHNLKSPFPEECNRQLTGIMADLHFSPTQTTKKYLLDEGKKSETIHVVGNSAIDTLKYTVKENFSHPILEETGDKKIILVTAHRRENIADLKNIFEAFNEIVESNSDCVIVYPIHMNPVIRKIASDTLSSDAIKIVEPLETKEFHNIMARSTLILTDSGGIQEEAPSLGKPVLVMRDTTERPEGVEAGTLLLVGTKKEDIVNYTNQLLKNKEMYKKMSTVKNPYGDGTTSIAIEKIVSDFLKI